MQNRGALKEAKKNEDIESISSHFDVGKTIKKLVPLDNSRLAIYSTDGFDESSTLDIWKNGQYIHTLPESSHIECLRKSSDGQHILYKTFSNDMHVMHVFTFDGSKHTKKEISNVEVGDGNFVILRDYRHNTDGIFIKKNKDAFSFFDINTLEKTHEYKSTDTNKISLSPTGCVATDNFLISIFDNKYIIYFLIKDIFSTNAAIHRKLNDLPDFGVFYQPTLTYLGGDSIAICYPSEGVYLLDLFNLSTNAKINLPKLPLPKLENGDYNYYNLQKLPDDKILLYRKTFSDVNEYIQIWDIKNKQEPKCIYDFTREWKNIEGDLQFTILSDDNFISYYVPSSTNLCGGGRKEKPLSINGIVTIHDRRPIKLIEAISTSTGLFPNLSCLVAGYAKECRKHMLFPSPGNENKKKRSRDENDKNTLEVTSKKINFNL